MGLTFADGFYATMGHIAAGFAVVGCIMFVVLVLGIYAYWRDERSGLNKKRRENPGHYRDRW